MHYIQLVYTKIRGTKVIHQLTAGILFLVCLMALVACSNPGHDNFLPVATSLPRVLSTLTPKVELLPIPRPTSTLMARPSLISDPTPEVNSSAPVIPQSTGLPTASPTLAVLPTGQLMPMSAPRVYETTITIPTYGYEQALESSNQDDSIYPYPHLNFDKVSPPAPKGYRAIILENDYTQLTILPELGGRILRWVDKATKKNLFYANPVIKPTQWGYRGWWLATGGMEWAFPVEEHGLIEYRPWISTVEHNGDTATIRVSEVEERTGLEVQIAVTLDSHHSYMTITPCIHNPTAVNRRYQFWLNGMFGLGDATVGQNTQFILPTRQVTIHSTGDDSFPGAGQQADWPNIAGHDLSWYKNWPVWLGVFASPSAQAGFMGAYNQDTDLGVVRVYPAAIARGAKIFASPGLDPGLWTDNGSHYFELWGGLLPTFWDNTEIAPNASICWTENWYAIGGTHGYDFANKNGAVRLTQNAGNITVALMTTSLVNGTVLLGANGNIFAHWSDVVGPDKPFNRTVQSSLASSSGLEVQLVDESGRTLLQYSLVRK